MTEGRSRKVWLLGLATVLLGLLANKWVLARILTADGEIGSSLAVAAILVVQLTLVGIGVYLMTHGARHGVRIRKEWLLAGVSILVTVVLLEIGVRVWLQSFSSPEHRRMFAVYTDVPQAQRQWTPHHYLNYAPTPGFSRGLTSHNSLGYRGPEFDLEKPASVYRIVALGGSTTYTTEVEDDAATYPAQLQRILREEFGYESVEVINAGVPGYNSWESLINLQFRALDLDPDLVIVNEGTNDVHTRIVVPEAYRGDNSGRVIQWSPPPISVLDRLALTRVASRALGLTQQPGIAAFVNAPTYLGAFSEAGLSPAEWGELVDRNPPTYLHRNLTNIMAISLAADVEVLIATWAFTPESDDYTSTEAYQRGLQQHHALMREIADEWGAPFFDFAAVMPTEREYWADGRHVNEAGAVVKARLFAEFIAAAGLIEEDEGPTG